MITFTLWDLYWFLEYTDPNNWIIIGTITISIITFWLVYLLIHFLRNK